MRLTEKLIITGLSLLMVSCIKAYYPEIPQTASRKYVVNGKVSTVAGWQEAEISLSSPIDSPSSIPVSGCQASITDDKNNVWPLSETEAGKYRVWMEEQYLQPGTSYKIIITTPDGKHLSSDFDKMPEAVPLDSVYYEVTDIPSALPDFPDKGMQFYVDLRAQQSAERYFKWDIEETWEYHSAFPFAHYYDGSLHDVHPPDSSKMVCWTTKPVRNIFTLSTASLSQNEYKKLPLHTVTGHTPRLGILYSVLVKQMTITEAAFDYWDKLRENINNEGGLYESQPVAIEGNLKNETEPENEVLGFFYAENESSRRYFYSHVQGIELDFTNDCYPEELGIGGWLNVTWAYPVWYARIDGFPMTLNIECLDCTTRGGTTDKPSFWPK